MATLFNWLSEFFLSFFIKKVIVNMLFPISIKPRGNILNWKKKKCLYLWELKGLVFNINIPLANRFVKSLWKTMCFSCCLKVAAFQHIWGKWINRGSQSKHNSPTVLIHRAWRARARSHTHTERSNNKTAL